MQCPRVVKCHLGRLFKPAMLVPSANPCFNRFCSLPVIYSLGFSRHYSDSAASAKASFFDRIEELNVVRSPTKRGNSVVASASQFGTGKRSYGNFQKEESDFDESDDSDDEVSTGRMHENGRRRMLGDTSSFRSQEYQRRDSYANKRFNRPFSGNYGGGGLGRVDDGLSKHYRPQQSSANSVRVGSQKPWLQEEEGEGGLKWEDVFTARTGGKNNE